MYLGRVANSVYVSPNSRLSRSALLLQPKTEDSHRLKIHVLDNDVDKNVLKTSDASCLCEAGLTSMINDCPMTVFGNVRIPPFSYQL